MGNQKGVQQEQNVCRGPAGEEVNISEETLDLKWPNKTLNAGMEPKQEVLAPSWGGGPALPLSEADLLSGSRCPADYWHSLQADSEQRLCSMRRTTQD